MSKAEGRAGVPSWPWGVIVPLVGAVGVGIGLASTPLFNVVGYEASATAGAVTPLLAVPLWFRRNHGTPLRQYLYLLTSGLILAALTLSVLLVAAIFVKNCALVEGLTFYALITGGSIVYMAAWGLVVGSMTDRRWLQVASYLGVYVLTWVATGLYLMWEPPITAYQPLIGYFAGSIYDEALGIPWQLVLYRALHLLIAAGVVAGLEARHRKLTTGRWQPGTLVVCVLTLLVATTMVFFRSESGLERRRGDIEHFLGSRIETEHFVIHYSASGWHDEAIEFIAADHEFRYAELAQIYPREPLVPGQKIHSFLYPDPQTKQALMGSGRTQVAKLWMAEIHVLYPRPGYSVLAHELSHVFSKPWGTGLLSLSTRGGVLPNMGLVEGLAEATAPRPSELSLDEWAAAMRQLDIAPDMRVLVSPTGFYQTASGPAYTLVGSFVRFLIERHGIERVLQAYGSADFDGAFEQSLDELVTAWEQHLDTIELQNDVLPIAQYRFDRKSIFAKACARRVGALRVEAQRLILLDRHDEAIDCLEEVVAHNDGSPAHTITLASVTLGAGDVARAEELTRHIEADDLDARTASRLKELRGDVAWKRGDISAARQHYQNALDIGLPWSTRRLLAAKHAVAGDELAAPVLIGLAEPPHQQLAAAVTWYESGAEHHLARYILARHLATHGYFVTAAGLYQPICTTDLSDVALLAECLRDAAAVNAVLGRWQTANSYLERLDRLDVPAGILEECNVWRRRVAFMSNRGVDAIATPK